MIARALRRWWDDRSGQAAVEFAIAFPVQLFVTFGLMQLVLVAIATLMVNYASHLAARAALVGEDPARAALVALSPLAGPTLPQADGAAGAFGSGLAIPGWGTLAGSVRVARKIHVRVNDDPKPFTPGRSRFTIADPEAYDDETRFSAEALDARDRIREALGDSPEARVVVEFDYELIFPVVDALLETLLRPAAGEAKNKAFGVEDGSSTADADDYTWIYAPGEGYLAGRGRVRTIGGAKHLVIAREASLYRGFATE